MASAPKPPNVSLSTKKQPRISSFFSKTSLPTAPTQAKADQQPDSPLADIEHGPFFHGLPNTRSVEGPDTSKRAADELWDDSTGEMGSLDPHSRKRPRTAEGTVDLEGRARNGTLTRVNSKARTLHPTTANELRGSGLSDRTSKFILSSSQPARANRPDDQEAAEQRSRLHYSFVKKLGRPDSLVEVTRRGTSANENGVGEEDEAHAGSEEDDARAPLKPKSGGSSKKDSSKQTPLEKQVIDIKSKHPNTVLVVEVGYKFRFFGEDARTAAEELHIVCIPGKLRYDCHPSESHLDRFASASIPVHRLHVHVRRLVSAGHKVGVVRQIETAALKAAGDNRNAPFERKLTNLYTKGTYIDDVDGLEPGTGELPQASASGYILGLTESKAKGWGTDEKVHVGMVAVQPATGDIIFDDFEDGFMRTEIETRLLHISPCEFLVVGELSRSTEKLVRHLSGTKTNVFGDKLRVERVERPKSMTANAYSHISNFYARNMKTASIDRTPESSNLLDKVLRLPEDPTVCLSALITHLSDYGLEHVFHLTKYFQPFSARSHMLLNGTTLASLEIYQNQTDHTRTGSLFWSLDRTSTRFGQRLLRKWVGRPLLSRSALEDRIAAVKELKDHRSKPHVEKLKILLGSVKTDLEKSLIRIYYGKCTRPELLSVLVAMQKIASGFSHTKSPTDPGYASQNINDAVAALPTILNDVTRFLDRINPVAAKSDDKYAFFRDTEETETIEEHRLGIASVEHDLDKHRAVAAEKLKKKRVDYVTSAGIEYLIEVENVQLKNVPASWVKISGTKRLSRFHTPDVVKLLRERDQQKESLAAACEAAYATFLRDISAHYQPFRDCVQALATLDCLMSLADIASQPGYVEPEFTNDTCINVKMGRHPMVEKLLLDGYVANDIELGASSPRALLITGPNMGGKSSYVRQVALIAIMGQIGSYVPAERAQLGMLDAVFTRMGAFDNMMAGESTFMVELSETSDILKQATPKSLVILDELGRGTSTHDGVAIAQAVLDFVARETRCLTLFITHYQNLSSMARAYEKGELQNTHMRFTEGGDSGQHITFLYAIGKGVAHRSYGYVVDFAFRSLC